jgi:hypothetical protein
MHDAGDHARCQFGCSPENPAPNQSVEFDEGRIEASRALAAKLGRNDPRVAVALDAREFLDGNPDIPGLIRAELECVVTMIDSLVSVEPDRLDMIQVRRARRILESLTH